MGGEDDSGGREGKKYHCLGWDIPYLCRLSEGNDKQITNNFANNRSPNQKVILYTMHVYIIEETGVERTPLLVSRCIIRS